MFQLRLPVINMRLSQINKPFVQVIPVCFDSVVRKGFFEFEKGGIFFD